MKFLGMDPLALNDHTVEVNAHGQCYDLHNGGWIQEITLKSSLTLAIRLDWRDPQHLDDRDLDPLKLRLSFHRTALLRVAQEEDDPRAADTLDNIVWRGPGTIRRGLVGITTGAYELELETDAMELRIS
jgi:hypothetical protein